MFSKLSIRQRLLIFGGVWLTVCTFLLTFYLVSQAKRAPFENAIQRGQMAVERLSEEASLHLHAGNHQAVKELLESGKSHRASIFERKRVRFGPRSEGE